jgi:hypothetical protein
MQPDGGAGCCINPAQVPAAEYGISAIQLATTRRIVGSDAATGGGDVCDGIETG